jgi:hypothetical protein
MLYDLYVLCETLSITTVTCNLFVYETNFPENKINHSSWGVFSNGCTQHWKVFWSNTFFHVVLFIKVDVGTNFFEHLIETWMAEFLSNPISFINRFKRNMFPVNWKSSFEKNLTFLGNVLIVVERRHHFVASNSWKNGF